MLFYPAQMCVGTFIHLLAIHIAVLLFMIFLFSLLLFIYVQICKRYISLKNSSRDRCTDKHLLQGMVHREKIMCQQRNQHQIPAKSHRHNPISCNWSTECIFKAQEIEISERKLARCCKLISLPFKSQKMFRDSRVSDVKSNVKGK